MIILTVLKKLWGQRHAFRQWIELALIIAVAYMAYHVFIRPLVVKPPDVIVKPPSVTIQQNTEQTDKILKKLDELEKRLSQTQVTGEVKIEEALKEKDIRKSVDRMREAW